jgi:hypothetical protein
MKEIDEVVWLAGDEDCGVSLMCRECDRGGLPIAYYGPSGGPYPYAGNRDVEPCRTIVALHAAAIYHVGTVHP